jgi:hypothetical protein
MAKPRIFISSTYYDLKHVRASLESFVSDMGYESVLFESGDIYFDPAKELDESCNKEIKSCHMLILIIGGRYGSPESSTQLKQNKSQEQYAFYNSITKNEYLTAVRDNKPVMVFVDSGVFYEYQTYKKNKDNTTIKYAHVDNVSIFNLLDEIINSSSHFVKTFEKIRDITTWLKEQWASMFCDYLQTKSQQIQISNLSEQLTSLSDISKTLKNYSEKMILSNDKISGEEIIEQANTLLKSKSFDRFKSNDLIEYCLELKKNTKSAEELYEIFKVSEDFESFITLSEFGEDFLEEHFHEEGRIRAIAVYDSLRSSLL